MFLVKAKPGYPDLVSLKAYKHLKPYRDTYIDRGSKVV